MQRHQINAEQNVKPPNTEEGLPARRLRAMQSGSDSGSITTNSCTIYNKNEDILKGLKNKPCVRKIPLQVFR